MQLRTEECGIKFTNYLYLNNKHFYWFKLSATMMPLRISQYIKRTKCIIE